MAFAGFFLLGAGWSVAAPYDGGPDERSHILRAVSVYWDGPFPKPVDAWRSNGTIQRVPTAFFPGDLARTVPATKFPAEMHGTPTPMFDTPVYTGRYNVAYYAIVGWPLRIWPNWTGLYLARFINALMVAGLLAAAVAAVVRSRRRALLAGVFVAVTPMTMHLAGTINPNGVEIAAGLLLFCSLIPALFDSDGPLPRAVLWQAGTAAVVLATVRVLGPLWVALILGILLFPLRRPMRDRLRQTPGLRRWVAVVSLAIVAGIAWTLIFKAYALSYVRGAGIDYTLSSGLRAELLVRWNSVIQQFVGLVAHNSVQIPGPFYIIWYMVFGLFLLGAITLGGWGERLRILALLGAIVVGPTLADVRSLHELGFQIQGRYLLPLLVGVFMLAAHVLADRMPDERAATSLVRMTAVITVPIHLIFLAFAMVYWQIGFAPDGPSEYEGSIPVNPLQGYWHPPLGSATALTLGVVGAAVLLVCAWSVRPAVFATPAIPRQLAPDTGDDAERPADSTQRVQEVTR